MYTLVAGDGALGGGVGGLEPLITVTQPVERLNLRIADFEVEVALSISVWLQLVQGWEEGSLWVILVPAECILAAGEQSARRVVAEHFREVIWTMNDDYLWHFYLYCVPNFHT